MTTSISQVPDLGPRAVARLKSAGIDTIDALRREGAAAAYLAAKTADPSTSATLLFQLAAAVDGRSAKDLTVVEKRRYRRQVEELRGD